MSTSTENPVCLSCGIPSVATLLDFGQQPPSNRFFRAGETPSETHALALGCCGACGLVQLIRPMPEAMVMTRHAWISYNEPEGHLDRMTDDLIRSTGLHPDARVLGLSYKDDTTLGRFNHRGFSNTYRFATREDLGIDDPMAGLETLQRALTMQRAEALVRSHGPADLLLARHVLEHAHAPVAFLRALARLVKPTGYIVLEVPESTKFLGAADYSFVWEEHIAYFTAATLGRLVPQANLETSVVQEYSFPLEDSLVAVVRPGIPHRLCAPVVAEETRLAENYGRRFTETRTRVRADLIRLKRDGKRVALFGAGHLAVKFLNLFELKDLVYCVVDDNPHKLGLRMPGSGVEVRPSTVLTSEHVDLCLLSLSPESEKRVIAAKQEYVSQGGKFRSIFALSPIAYEEVAP